MGVHLPKLSYEPIPPMQAFGSGCATCTIAFFLGGQFERHLDSQLGDHPLMATDTTPPQHASQDTSSLADESDDEMDMTDSFITNENSA